MSLPWVEKYRPAKLDSIVGQEEIIKLLKKALESGNLPHLLLYGPPGTGKTSTIFAFATELFGPINFKERVIEVNASDERGINVVRNKIIEFTRRQISTPDKNYPSPNYKLIILDEADTLTNEAQSALRKVLEDNSSITRFCFLCNYLNRIIDPIVSRCNKYCFKPLATSLIIKKIGEIARDENLNFSDEVITTIAAITEGDLRRSISVLQNLKYLHTHKITLGKMVESDDVKELCGLMPAYLEIIIKDVCFNKTTNVQDITKLATTIISGSYTIYSVIDSLLQMVLEYETSDVIKSKMIWYFLDIERQLLAGSDEYLQLLSLLTHIHQIIKNVDQVISC
jgi:replication factor C subunit 2/4